MVFNLRLNDDLQKTIKIEAAKCNKSMNNFITEAVVQYIENQKKIKEKDIL